MPLSASWRRPTCDFRLSQISAATLSDLSQPSCALIVD